MELGDAAGLGLAAASRDVGGTEMLDAILGALWGSGVPVIALAVIVGWLLPGGRTSDDNA